MAHITLKVNGGSHVLDVDPECPLLYVLRDDLAMHNPRFGCGLGQCGACTVIINKKGCAFLCLPYFERGGERGDHT
jgi:nicotinate dehydrogenase subunit A